VHHQRPVNRRGGQCTWSEPAIYGVQACGVKLWLASFGISEIFACPETQISNICPAVPSHRGALRTSRTRGGMRWTQAALKTRAPACGRRSRVVLTPRRRRQVCGNAGDGDKKARSPGRARSKP
jgi:hypothetical protein